ncbi:Transcriptional regulator CRZ1 [Hypsizygus marmoreus]|uniref:Transcriptional regulator CRZ1 n=1 Tax=Hypsizygus marmoreus TaxID=39966 RepID=A0A369K088_HYPMA|nr:Transcriptional regulator CRZ1 [Hypsizygus marmoreus]
MDATRVGTSPIILTHSPSPHPPPNHEPQNDTVSLPFLSPMPKDRHTHYTAPEPLYGPAGGPMSPAIPLHGPVSHPDGPHEYTYTHIPHLSQFSPHPPDMTPNPSTSRNGRHSPKREPHYPDFHRSHDSSPPSPGQDSTSSHGGAGANHYPAANNVRLPPILQVEKQQVTTSATQLASASRRRNEAHFVCPVPGCGSTFTRRFNLRGHLRSHTEERPYVCEWPGCNKGFARQHDCKRHQALHTAKSQANVCRGCKKAFSRLDALNRHLRSDGGADCRAANPKYGGEHKYSGDHKFAEDHKFVEDHKFAEDHKYDDDHKYMSTGEEDS